MANRPPTLANLVRAMREQIGNYDEATEVVFELPDGSRYVWDTSDVDGVDWEGGTAVLYLVEELYDGDEDDGDDDDDDL